MVLSRTFALLLALALGGCANLSAPGSAPDVGIDGVACQGTVADLAPAASASGNPVLVDKARLATDKGGVCAAKVYALNAPVTLYRVFDSRNPYTKFGSWWSLKPPAGSKDDYRAANAICKEWSNLDRVVSCQIRPGTQIVVGTTQSAVCADGSVYPKTAENQVFVPNDGRAGIIHVGACGDEADWP